MNDKKLFMWLFILLLLACVAGYFYVRNEATSTQTAADYRRPVKDNGPRFPQGNRPDFTTMLDEQEGRPAAGWDKRTSRYAPTEPKLISRPVSQTVTYESNRPSSAPNRAALQAEQSARMGTPAARLGNTSYAPARSYNPAGNNGAKSDYSNTTVYDSDNGGKDLLAAYTPKQTRQEKQALNQKIADFSSGLEKAFVQALQPKSKREQNIEKYLNHSQNSTEPTAAASVSAPVE